MCKRIILAAAVLVLPVMLTGETLRLKYPATVEVLNDDGKVTGTRSLRAGTVVLVDSSETLVSKDTTGKGEKKIVPLDLSSSKSKAARHAASKTICAALTKKGHPCKRKAAPGSIYCWQHKK